MEWITLEKEIGAKGSEGGIIIRDEEYDESCRASLERCSKYYAVTCGVYGSMVHTAFFGADDYEAKYEEIKHDLQGFVDKVNDMTEDERCNFYSYFCDKY